MTRRNLSFMILFMKKGAQERFVLWAEILLLSSFSAACLVFLFHALVANPQPDTQLLTYAAELRQAVRDGNLGEYFLTVRKYPFLPTLLLALVLFPSAALVNVLADLSPFALLHLRGELYVHFIARAVTLLYAFGTLFVLRKISRMLFQHAWAVMLLLSSVLFLVFATAVRPHLPVTFWSVLSLYFSLRLEQEKTTRNTCASFGAALAAFCTLQNGLFAVIFPVWGYLSHGRTRKDILLCAGFVGALLLLSFPLGYSYLLSPLFGRSVSVGLDLGHNQDVQWNGRGFLILAKTLLGSELFLFLFSLSGSVAVLRDDVLRHKAFPLLLFIGSYSIVFGLYRSTDPRFFIVLLPFLALLGAAALGQAPRSLQTVFLCITVLIHMRFAFLGLQPNTYAVASAYMNSVDGHLASEISPHLFRIPHNRFEEDGTPPVFGIVPTEVLQSHVPPAGWRECVRIVSSRSHKDMFLWTEVPWALYRLFEAKRLGPNISILCREEGGLSFL